MQARLLRARFGRCDGWFAMVAAGTCSFANHTGDAAERVFLLARYVCTQFLELSELALSFQSLKSVRTRQSVVL